MPPRFDEHDVLVDLEGNPIISDTEAIHIITGEGFGKLKRVGLRSVYGDLIQDALLEVSFELSDPRNSKCTTVIGVDGLDPRGSLSVPVFCGKREG